MKKILAIKNGKEKLTAKSFSGNNNTEMGRNNDYENGGMNLVIKSGMLVPAAKMVKPKTFNRQIY